MYLNNNSLPFKTDHMVHTRDTKALAKHTVVCRAAQEAGAQHP